MDFDHFTAGFLTTKADTPQRTDAEDAAIQDAHMSHLAELHAAGHLLAAGPLLDEHYRGMLLFKTSVETAQELMADDPAVAAGWFDLTLMPWMVPPGALHFMTTKFPRSMNDAAS